MDPNVKALKLSLDAHAKTTFEFIVTELDLALTFYEIALSSDDRGKAKRNRGHARRAYDAAVHFLDRGKLHSDQRREINDRLTKLKPMVSAAEEVLKRGG